MENGEDTTVAKIDTHCACHKLTKGPMWSTIDTIKDQRETL